MGTYTYSISADTANGVVNEGSLKKEIEAVASGVSVQVLSVGVNGDQLSIIFKTDLEASEQTALGILVANHLGLSTEVDEPEEVKVMEENPLKRTGGNFYATGIVHEVPATAISGEETYLDFSFPYPVAMLDMELVPTTNMMGDKISICLSPDTVVGAITSSLEGGETVLDVSSTVTDNMKIGYAVSITDGTNTDSLGKCVNVDAENGQITVQTAVANAYLPTTPTYVRLTVPVLEDIPITGVAAIAFGSGKIGGSYVPAGSVIRLHYKNYELSAKSFGAILEMLY